MQLVAPKGVFGSTFFERNCNEPDQDRTKSQNEISSIALIGGMKLDRECLVQIMALTDGEVVFHGFPSGDAFCGRDAGCTCPDVIVLKLDWNELLGPAGARTSAQLMASEPSVPIVALTEVRDVENLHFILELGIRGVIPTDIGIEFFMPALKLALSGRVLLWSNALHPARHRQSDDATPRAFSGLGGNLTPREVMVAEALRSGKSNKVIARELDIRESTVKVHVGRILRKLEVTNRTAAAFEINRRAQDVVPDGAAQARGDAEPTGEMTILRFNRRRTAAESSGKAGTA